MIHINLIGDDHLLARYSKPTPSPIPDLIVVPDHYDPCAYTLTGPDSDMVPHVLLEHLIIWVWDNFNGKQIMRGTKDEMTAMVHAELYLMLERRIIFKARTGKWIMIENWWEHMPADHVYYLNDSNRLSPNLPSQY